MTRSPGEFDFVSPEPEEEFDFESSEAEEVAPPNERKPCPMCGEMVAAKARMCRFCGERLDGGLPDARGGVDEELIKKFRREVHGVGGFWIFVAVMHAVVGAVIFAKAPFGNELSMLVFVGAFVYTGIGVVTFLKQRWALYVGLVLGYLGLVAGFAQLAVTIPCAGIFGIVIHIFVVIQIHRTINWARQLVDNGIPLTAKPGDYR